MGYNIFSFWDLTWGEIILILNQYNKLKEEKIADNYQQAYFIYLFVGSLLNSKTPPALEGFLPSKQKEYEEQQLKVLEAQMMDFAYNRNKKYKEARNGGK